MKNKQKPQKGLTKQDIEEMQKQVDEDQAKQTKPNPFYTGKTFDETIGQILKVSLPKQK